MIAMRTNDGAPAAASACNDALADTAWSSALSQNASHWREQNRHIARIVAYLLS
jgi:hypothetical protein